MDERNSPSVPSSPSLDCPNGLECDDYECECRHLDEIELAGRQSVFRYPSSNPNLIVTASRDMGRSASTWVFNAVRLLYRHAGEACDSYWIRELSRDKLLERCSQQQQQQRAHVLVKTHEQYHMSRETFEKDIAPLLTHIVVSVREELEDCHGQPQPSDDAMAVWMEYATHIISYQDIVAHNENKDSQIGALKVLRGLANHLNISGLSDDDLRVVDYQLMTLPIPGNQATKFWPFHARRGGRHVPAKPSETLLQQQRQQSGSSGNSTCTSMDVLVTRHGARIDNGPDRDRHWLDKVEHGRLEDAHLSPSGYQAASELASEIVRLRDANITHVRHVVSSPFVRCVETANAVAEALDVSIKIEPGIAEVGSAPTHVASQQILKEKFPRIDDDYVPIMQISELPGRNEYGDGAAARRAAKVGTAIRDQLQQGTILFVGHGASCLGLVDAFGGGQYKYVGYCSLSFFQYVATASLKEERWRLVGQLGGVSHLSDKSTALDSAW